MSLAFDLISDLHLETWPGFDWSERATSPFCIVAGDVCRDRDLLLSTLDHLSHQYQAVFYIDGNDEHRWGLDDLNASYVTLYRQLKKLKNVVYLQDNVVVVDNVAIVATNGWFGFDFDLSIDPEQAMLWCEEEYNLSTQAIINMKRMASTDAQYMISSIKRLQTHNDVKKIVVVTHTVPDPALIQHDISLDGKMRFNVMGNRYMMQALAADTERKIDTWCFGHYHGSVDSIRSNIRFVNNCRGRGDSEWRQWVYHPRRIEISVD